MVAEERLMPKESKKDQKWKQKQKTIQKNRRQAPNNSKQYSEYLKLPRAQGNGWSAHAHSLSLIMNSNINIKCRKMFPN